MGFCVKSAPAHMQTALV